MCLFCKAGLSSQARIGVVILDGPHKWNLILSEACQAAWAPTAIIQNRQAKADLRGPLPLFLRQIGHTLDEVSACLATRISAEEALAIKGFSKTTGQVFNQYFMPEWNGQPIKTSR